MWNLRSYNLRRVKYTFAMNSASLGGVFSADFVGIVFSVLIPRSSVLAGGVWCQINRVKEFCCKKCGSGMAGCKNGAFYTCCFCCFRGTATCLSGPGRCESRPCLACCGVLCTLFFFVSSHGHFLTGIQ